MPKFIVKHPDRGEQTFALSGARITVGRRADNDVQIVHETISGYHAEIVALNGHYLLRDRDSTNHCFIDGVQVEEARLTERCKILIGGVECEYIAGVPAAPTDEANLRKTIGMLRQQNEALADRIADQQKQIRILGSARLVSSSAGADLQALHDRVKELTEDRDRLARENQELRRQFDRPNPRMPDGADLRETVPVSLPPPPQPRAVRIGPGGEATVVAQLAHIVAEEPASVEATEVPA